MFKNKTKKDHWRTLEVNYSHLYQDFVDGLGPHPLSNLPFWRRINRLRGQKAQKNITTLKIDGLIVTDEKNKTKIFADRLERVFNDDGNPYMTKNTTILLTKL